MTRTCDVAIIGGGIGGLTLARSLLARSISAQIFEQDTELREIGAGIAIAGNASRLLARLGIDLTGTAHQPPAFQVRSWRDGSLIWSHPLGAWYRKEIGAPLLMLHRATLQRGLAAALPPERVSLGHQVTGISDEPSGVRLRFGNGGEATARIVVAADGVLSATRRYVCGEVRPRQSGEIGFRGVIRAADVPDLPDPGALSLWSGPGTHAIIYGVDGGETINLLLVHRPDPVPEWTRSANRRPAEPDEARAIFAAYSWDDRILDLVRNIDGDMNFWALADLPHLPRWSRGRVALLGDAAHAPLPHQGQGAAMAIEDAYLLGELLGKAGRDDYGSVFGEYERIRRLRTWRVQAYSRFAGRAVEFTGPAATRRDEGWPSLPGRIGWIHRHNEAR